MLHKFISVLLFQHNSYNHTWLRFVVFAATKILVVRARGRMVGQPTTYLEGGLPQVGKASTGSVASNNARPKVCSAPPLGRG